MLNRIYHLKTLEFCYVDGENLFEVANHWNSYKDL